MFLSYIIANKKKKNRFFFLFFWKLYVFIRKTPFLNDRFVYNIITREPTKMYIIFFILCAYLPYIILLSYLHNVQIFFFRFKYFSNICSHFRLKQLKYRVYELYGAHDLVIRKSIFLFYFCSLRMKSEN